MQVESAFNPRARSPKGALGLMQLMPATARQFGVADPFDPAENVGAGVAYLRQLLEGCAVLPGSLKLEITESTAVAGSLAVLKRIRALGAGLAIDDFGTGQSSLSRLKDLPFDTVKIDQSFVHQTGRSSDKILRAIVSLARDLGLSTGTGDSRGLEDMSLEEVEAYLIKKALARAGGNARQAAEALGLSRSTFYRRLQQYGL